MSPHSEERARLLRALADAVRNAEAKAAKCQERREWARVSEWHDNARTLTVAHEAVSLSAADHEVLPRLAGRGLVDPANAGSWLEAIALALACGVR